MNKSIAPMIYAALRIVAGFVYLSHGLQKFGMFGGPAQPLALLSGSAATIEAVAGTLILLGLFTRPAAFVASGQMAAAYFIAHIGNGLLPIQNHGDSAVLLSFMFLYVWATGPGIGSVDGLLRGRSGS
jgi:putative oxidoreductase